MHGILLLLRAFGRGILQDSFEKHVLLLADYPPAKTLKPVYYTHGVGEQLSLFKTVSHHLLGRLGDREPAGVPVLGSWPLGRAMFIHNF